MKAVILVGGEGTRLRPLSLGTPKPLMPVANRPFLSHVLAHLAGHGVDEAVLTTGYLARAFDAFPPDEAHGVRLTVFEEPTPLGTCGAVKAAEDVLDSTFLVLNGDILTDLDVTALVAYHREKGSVGTIALTHVEEPAGYGLVPLHPDGRVDRFVEKPRADEIVTDLVNAGVYVLEPDILKRVPAGQPYSFERDLFPDLLADLAPMFGFASTSYWLDMGTPARYLRANIDVLEGKVGEPAPGRETPSGARVGDAVRIDPAVRLRGPAALGDGCRVDLGGVIYPGSCLGPRCRIGPGAAVEEAVLHAEVVLEEGAVVRRSVLARGVRVGAGTRVADAVIGAGARIGADNELRGGIRVWPGVEIPDGSIRF